MFLLIIIAILLTDKVHNHIYGSEFAVLEHSCRLKNLQALFLYLIFLFFFHISYAHT